MINDNKEKNFDIEENNENEIIEIKCDDSENDEKKFNNIKNDMDENDENKININKNDNIESNENKANDTKSDVVENNENKIIEIINDDDKINDNKNIDNAQKNNDNENDEFQINEIKNDYIFENNENKIIVVENNDANIGGNNNINDTKNDDNQYKIIVENTENQKNDIKNDVIENDEKKNSTSKNEDHIITHENKEDLKKEIEISEEELKKLFDIIFYQTIFNKKKTKIKSQNDYEFIIKIINKLKEKEFELFFRYLHDINISIFKIVVNGFIEFNFNDEKKEKNILNIISRVTSLCLNKNMFFFIYKKLSKYYRKRYKIDSIDSIKKFEKIFKVWKELYNPLNLKSFYEKNNSFIAFFPKPNKKNKNIIIKYDIKDTCICKISIKILPFPFLKFNQNNKDFSFIKIYLDKEPFVINYDYIFLNENKINLSEINEISFFFQPSQLKIYYNINKPIKTAKISFSFSSVSKIEILNNFIGYISSITINNDIMKIDEKGEFGESKKYEIKLEKNEHNKLQHLIYINNVMQEFNTLINGIDLENIFSEELLDLNNNNKDKNNTRKCLSRIKWFGGIESFIPIFKILKYIINKLNNLLSNKNENEKILDYYINESIDWIKDILKIMLKMICLSENNYKNFKNIIIPLLGSLSEIYHSLISFKELSLKNYVSNLFNDEIFFILYIIILNQNIPVNIKDAFGFIFGINENFNNFNFTMEPIIFNIKEIKINDLKWYFFIIIYFIEFFLLYFDSKEKIPQNLIKQLDLILQEELYFSNETLNDDSDFLSVMKYLNNFVKEFSSNNNFENQIEEILSKEKLFKYVLHLINIFLNVEIIKEKRKKKESSILSDKFRNFLLEILKNMKSSDIQQENIKKILINNFKFYKSKMKFLNDLYPFLEEKYFISEDKFLLEEIVDYNGKYHHLMKELFIFNRLWSDQKLYFANTSDAMKNSKLKYKNINYYTRNFQKPIIYPYLDYKNHYPEFSKYEIGKDLYKEGCENTDDYNFNLDCPELDKFIQDRNNKKIEEIKKNEDILLETACFIKQKYHVKGDFFLSKNTENSFSIYFYSYPLEKQNDYKIQPNCNKKKIYESKAFKESNSNLCYGAVFKCLDKECKRKLVIDSDDIRLIMKRIYFYRKSSIEIFTNTKSYYFNFENEDKMNKIFKFINDMSNNIYLPININNDINGLLKIKPNILEDIDQSKNFIDLIKGNISKGQLFEMCTFDLIILINLISNRSLNDLNQYPVFPLLYFYDKSSNSLIQRNLNEHIGFQVVTDEAKRRKKLLKETYDGNLDEIDGDDKSDEIACLFNTHYSNIIYTSNYLIRLFPFSLLSIELQGDGFDNPNRLFFSIQETFYNISTQKADLRELIPEFFYFPEMLINLNCFNFGKRTNNESVDDVNVNIQEIISKKNNNIELDFEKKNIRNKNEANNNLNNNEDEKYFLFVDEMKNKLESLRAKIHNWLDLIFGPFQRKSSKNIQYFRKESYIENEKKELEKYINDDDTMKSVEFGVIPLKTISDKNSFKDKHYDYGYLEYKKDKKLKFGLGRDSSKRNSNSLNSKKSDKLIYEKYEIDNYFENKNKDYNYYWDIDLDLDFRINKENGDGELEIYKNKNLIEELMDHNGDILHIFYNKRLNMFGATSKDGFIYIYIIPNKLFSVIKHPDNRYYNKVYLSANPFPTIIAYDEENKSLTSYSLSGIMIKKVKIKEKEKDNIEISPIFNIYGGAFKDRIKIFSENQNKNIFCNIPFFDKIDL